MFNSLESKFKLSLGLALIGFLGGYLNPNNLENNLLKKYQNKEFSLEENIEKKVYEFPFDINSDGFYEGVFIAFDLNKKPWKKEKIESVGYFKYSGGGMGPLEDKATFFYTFNKGDLNKINGGLIDSNGDKILDNSLDQMSLKYLLLNLMSQSQKYKKGIEKNNPTSKNI